VKKATKGDTAAPHAGLPVGQAAVSLDAAVFRSAKNLSRSNSACFLPIALAPCLELIIWRFRLVGTFPSGSSSSSLYRKNQYGAARSLHSLIFGCWTLCFKRTPPSAWEG